VPADVELEIVVNHEDYEPWISSNYPAYDHFSIKENESEPVIIEMRRLDSGDYVRTDLYAFVGYGNETSESKFIIDDAIPQRTIPADSTIEKVDIYVEDRKEDARTGLSLDAYVNTNCTTSIASWSISELGDGYYSLLGDGEKYLNVPCPDTSQFILTIAGGGIYFEAPYYFEAESLKGVWGSALAGSDWVYEYVDVYAYGIKEKEIEKEITPDNCTMVLYFSNGTVLGANTTAAISGNRVYHNFTSLSTVPTSVLAKAECEATGFETTLFTSPLSKTYSDILVHSDCAVYLASDLATVPPYVMFEDDIVHRCIFGTHLSADLSDVVLRVDDDKGLVTNEHLRLLTNNTQNYTFEWLTKAPLRPAKYRYTLTPGNWPSGVGYNLEQMSYPLKVVDYTVRPRELPCPTGGCTPPLLSKGEDYYCTIGVKGTTAFTTAYMTVSVNNIDYRVPDADLQMIQKGGNTWFGYEAKGIGTTSNTWGLADSSATLECKMRLEYECWDCDDFLGVIEPSGYYTTYTGRTNWDFFGFFGWLKRLSRSNDPMEDFADATVRAPGNLITGIISAVIDDCNDQGECLPRWQTKPLDFMVILGILMMMAALLLVWINSRRR